MFILSVFLSRTIGKVLIQNASLFWDPTSLCYDRKRFGYIHDKYHEDLGWGGEGIYKVFLIKDQNTLMDTTRIIL